MSRVASQRSIPFVDLARQHAPLADEIADALRGVIEASAFTLGPEVERFEAEWADYCGTRFAIGVNSGTAALWLTLRALGVGDADEVIVPANTFVATAFAVAHVGARPVLVDSDPETGTIDVAATEAAVTARTRAVIPVHLYGQAADMDPLLELASARGFYVIEDAAQAHGATYGGRRVGALGTAGCFSFYPSKNLGAIGDGGAIVTDDEALARKLRIARDLGQTSKYVHVDIGHTERLHAVQAAVLRVKLPHLETWNAQRREVASLYDEHLSELPVELPKTGARNEHVWHIYAIRSDARDRIRTALTERGIATGLHYPTPLHLQEAFEWLGYPAGAFPATEEWSARSLSLPMFAELEASEVETVAAAIAASVGDDAD